MPLTVASSFARRGRGSQSLAPTALAVFNSGTALHRHHQARGYRFGRLSSYLDPYFHPVTYTRHQPSGRKYCDNLYHHQWSKHTLSENAKTILRQVLHDPWVPHPKANQGSERCVKAHTTPDNPQGVRPGQNIEDAERAPLEHLLFGSRRGPQPRKGSSSQETTPVDYIIDPITNRKVPKKSSESAYSASDRGIEIPVRASRPYQSQFEPFRAPDIKDAQSPFFPDGPPPPAELRMYRQAQKHIENEYPTIHHYGSHRSRRGRKAIRWHRSGAISSGHAASASVPWSAPPEYTDLHQYTAVRYQEPDGKPAAEKAPAQEYDDLDQYGAVRSHEPNGKYARDYTEPPDEAELVEYSKPFLAHEPDGKYAAQQVEAETEADYDAAELDKYRQPFFSHEPDGKYAVAQAEAQEHDAELSQYRAFRSHEPDGKYAGQAEEDPDAAELVTYGPYRASEPDGKYSLRDKVTAEPADTQTYGAFRSHEPDGKYALRDAAPAEAVEDRQYGAFRSHEPDGKYAAEAQAAKAAEAVEDKVYTAFRSHEPDGKYALRDTTPAELVEEKRYESFRSHEPDGKYAAEAQAARVAEREAKDLANHEAFSYQDAETRPLPQETTPAKRVAELREYTTPQPDVNPSPADAQQTVDAAELRSYQAVRWNEPDGKLTTAAPPTGQSPVFDYDLNTPYRRKVEELMAQTAAAEPSPTPESPASQPTNHPIPAVYKILVYDPTTHSVETAETTSLVADSATPLSPAEVLPRVSSPAKFVPHFAPLQAQGFEVVSGGGDVLVFRKVCEAVEAAEQAGIREAHPAPPVNPIDMTGGRGGYTVAAGRFASPTGFVNYNLPMAEGEVAPAAAAAVGGVKEQMGKEGGKKKKAGVVKRMAVGAVTVGGVSYVLGGLGEHLRKSGGGEGKKGVRA
ncbi:hypothetical protein C8A05DRAFT_19374 [Staphylotrichum tortipilum]|uniref:Uncharacterized protein n=1 Tax=Staphylotrichum tortipilum TaxID=2831512 RepID=A0AAN6RPS2_9PEZI|nr:hypothetical protein C8A05DRAFT_19374 [Staphylotrichum longicolle]